MSIENYASDLATQREVFRAHQLPDGSKVPAVLLMHGGPDTEQAATPDHPIPVADADVAAALQGLASAAGQAAAVALLNAIASSVDGVEGSLTSILAKLIANPATEATLAAISGKVPALVSGRMPMLLGASTVPSDLVADSAGNVFSPASCSHTYGYTAGALTTDTATLAGVVRVKTYTYSAGVLTGESLWVAQ